VRGVSSCVVALSKHSIWALDVPQDLAANATAADLANKARPVWELNQPDSMAVEPYPQGLPFMCTQMHTYTHTYIYVSTYISVIIITIRIFNAF
jgi:hypothetical protein